MLVRESGPSQRQEVWCPPTPAAAVRSEMGKLGAAEERKIRSRLAAAAAASKSCITSSSSSKRGWSKLPDAAAKLCSRQSRQLENIILTLFCPGCRLLCKPLYSSASVKNLIGIITVARFTPARHRVIYQCHLLYI